VRWFIPSVLDIIFRVAVFRSRATLFDPCGSGENDQQANQQHPNAFRFHLLFIHSFRG